MTKALQKCYSTQLSEIAAPVGTPWMWTLAFWHHEGRTPTHGCEATREAAMAAFAKSWRREIARRTCVLGLLLGAEALNAD